MFSIKIKTHITACEGINHDVELMIHDSLQATAVSEVRGHELSPDVFQLRAPLVSWESLVSCQEPVTSLESCEHLVSDEDDDTTDENSNTCANNEATQLSNIELRTAEEREQLIKKSVSATASDLISLD